MHGSRIILSRVADLERSVQWTSLTKDIDNLERRRIDVDRSMMDRDGKIERHTYQRGSIPEMQRACTVRCDDRLQKDSDSYPELENSRWSWKPRTDFEREYFYKDYKDYYARGDSGTRFQEKPDPVHEIFSAGDRSYREETRSSCAKNPVACTSLSSSTRYPVGLEKEHFSDSRDRLHEIFEHNRYLRRQFFADVSTGNSRRDRIGLHSGNLDRSNHPSSRRCIGFGSTETLTSQSNQSSMSSINDRKSRMQTTRTPEEEEEEEEEDNALIEFARRNNVVPFRKFNSSRVDRESNGNDVRTDKVLVNILPGNEIKRVDVRNVSVINLGETNDKRNDYNSSIVEAMTQNATREQRMLDNYQRRENESNLVAWRRKNNLPEYVFGEDARDRSTRDNFERNWNLISQNEIRDSWTSLKNERSVCVLPNVEATSTRRNEEGIRRDFCKSLPNLKIRKRNLDAPLYVARAVNVPDEKRLSASNNYALDSHIARSGHGSGQCREQRSGKERRDVEGRTRSIDREQSISEATTVSPKRLTPRSKIGTTRIVLRRLAPPPPPLDLSTVNEQCERIEMDERRYLNDYSVDVAILRNHEDLVKDLLTVNDVENERRAKDVVGKSNATIDDENPSGNDRSCGRNDDGIERSFFPREFYGDLRYSPGQLVNNCKSDSRMKRIDPVPRIHRCSIDPDASRRDSHRRAASPLSDQTSPIGGFHAAGSTLPSTVYGPIPYSQ